MKDKHRSEVVETCPCCMARLSIDLAWQCGQLKITSIRPLIAVVRRYAEEYAKWLKRLEESPADVASP